MKKKPQIPQLDLVAPISRERMLHRWLPRQPCFPELTRSVVEQSS